MNVYELIEILSAMESYQKVLPVFVQDGLDPSDPVEANKVSVELRDAYGCPDRVEINSR